MVAPTTITTPPGERERPPRDFALELRFTDAWRRYEGASPAQREAMCLRAQYPGWFTPIQEDDLFAGRLRPAQVGFSPDEWGLTSFGYFCRLDAAAVDGAGIAGAAGRRVQEMISLWRSENTSARVRSSYPPHIARWLPSDNWMGEPGIAFPLYRLCGGAVDNEKLMRLGLPGLRLEVESHRRADEEAFFDASLTALGVLEDVCRHYREQARDLADRASEQRRRELMDIAAALDAVIERAPATFREAIQLLWLYALAGDIRNHGRLDVALGEFLERDLEAGALDEPGALRLLQSLWRLMAARATRVHGRVVVGGVGRSNEAAADRFALLAMEATRLLPAIEPQLSLRFYRGQDPALMKKALDVLAEGRTFPILYNDDVNVPAAAAAFGVQRAEAEQYVPYGCGEYVLPHRSFGTPSGVINLLKALEVTLHNGQDPFTGREAGPALGKLAAFDTFDKLWSAYCRQVEHFVAILAEQEAREYRVAGDSFTCLYQSLLYDDCLERGRGILSGGARWLGGTVETYGNTSVSDSLTAIRRLVYDQKRFTLQEVVTALDADFDGHAGLRRALRECPKYGNDDEEADSMVMAVHEHVCRAASDQAERVGLSYYLVVVINNSANTLMGRHTAASADGRSARQPMSNGNAPSSGNDRSGITALLSSLVKPASSLHAGAVQNLKLSQELATRCRPQLEALLETYWQRGGAQVMITVVSRRDLERAMEEPENYAHVFVRVGGFSARFIDLPKDVQQEILERTLY